MTLGELQIIPEDVSWSNDEETIQTDESDTTFNVLNCIHQPQTYVPPPVTQESQVNEDVIEPLNP